MQIKSDHLIDNFFRTRHPCIQKETFRIQLQIAKMKDLPIVLHIRDADEDGLEILRGADLPNGYPLHLHCFNSNWIICQTWLREFSGLKIGITPLITYPCSKHLIEVVQRVPLQRLLLETDAPYFNVEEESSFSDPGQVAHTLAQIHAIRRRESLEDIMTETRRNVQEVYRIPMDLSLSPSEKVVKIDNLRGEEPNDNIRFNSWEDDGLSEPMETNVEHNCDDFQVTRPMKAFKTDPKSVKLEAKDAQIEPVSLSETTFAQSSGLANQDPKTSSREEMQIENCLPRVVDYELSEDEEVSLEKQQQSPYAKGKRTTRAKVASESYASSEAEETE